VKKKSPPSWVSFAIPVVDHVLVEPRRGYERPVLLVLEHSPLGRDRSTSRCPVSLLNVIPSAAPFGIEKLEIGFPVTGIYPVDAVR